MTPTPTGEIREVPLDDLLFSTTDAQGVIDQVNDVFARTCRSPRHELIGATHDVIRHPQMPDVLFRSLWDLLRQRRPVCAYLLNLAADGAGYWTFATFAPVGDRFVSVQATACDVATRDLVLALYEQVRAAEVTARQQGGDTDGPTVAGRDFLAEALADNGSASYQQFQCDLAPVEMAAREDRAPAPPSLAGGAAQHQELIAEVGAVRSLLVEFSGQLDGVVDRSRRLRRNLRRASASMASLAEAVTDAGSTLADPGIASPVAAALLDVAETVDGLLAPLDELVEAHSQRQADIAIARLQAEAMGRCVAAGSTEVEDPWGLPDVLTDLSQALLAVFDADLVTETTAATAFLGPAQELASSTSSVRQAVVGWRDEVTESADRPPAGDLARLDLLIGGLQAAVERVERDLLAPADRLGEPDRDRLAGRLARVAALAAQE